MSPKKWIVTILIVVLSFVGGYYLNNNSLRIVVKKEKQVNFLNPEVSNDMFLYIVHTDNGIYFVEKELYTRLMIGQEIHELILIKHGISSENKR